MQRKNAGVKGDEMKNMLDMQKNLRQDLGQGKNEDEPA